MFRGVDGTQLVLFALLVALVPGLALWALGAATRVFGPPVRAGVHLVTVAVLVGVAVLVAVRLADLAKGGPALVIAVGAGLLGGLLYARVAGVRQFLLYLSPLPLLAAGLFLFSSPVSGLVNGADAEVVEDVDSTRPVVMLVLDEFPTAALLDDQGGIDATQFPNFARLAMGSTWFRNYTTHNAGTVQAVPSLLSGQLPTRGRAPLVTDWPTNLFTLLGGSYEMAVQETVTQLCPPSVCRNASRTVTQRTPVDGEGLEGAVSDATDVLSQLVSLNAEPEVAVDEFTEETVSVPAPDEMGVEDRNQVTNQPTRFTDFLEGMVRGEDPTLHFVHLILPHGPWRFFPDGTEYVSPDGDPEGEIAGTWTDAWPAELTRLRLELQSEYTDALVGRTIDRMQATGLWDDALFVVVADHGGAFVVDEPGRALGEDNAFEVMWTPLFIRDPDLAPGVDETDMEATDLLPTMADLLGIDLPYEVQGASAVSRPGHHGDEAVHAAAERLPGRARRPARHRHGVQLRPTAGRPLAHRRSRRPRRWLLPPLPAGWVVRAGGRRPGDRARPRARPPSTSARPWRAAETAPSPPTSAGRSTGTGRATTPGSSWPSTVSSRASRRSSR